MGIVFLAASDESNGANSLGDFQTTGWLAPESDWYQFFNPAWRERVLDKPPRIPYLHVTEMRSRTWREEHGITRLDADDRLDEAVDIIKTLGSLRPVQIKVMGGDFRKLFHQTEFKTEKGARKKYEPDYYAYLPYAYAVLCRVKITFPDAERIDFMVEQKSGITPQMQGFHESLPASLRHIGRSDLVPLVGKFIPGSKQDIPLQAADFLCWHSQRAEAGTLDENDIRRWNPMARMKGFSFDMTKELMMPLAEAFRQKEKSLEAGAS